MSDACKYYWAITEIDLCKNTQCCMSSLRLYVFLWHSSRLSSWIRQIIQLNGIHKFAAHPNFRRPAGYMNATIFYIHLLYDLKLVQDIFIIFRKFLINIFLKLCKVVGVITSKRIACHVLFHLNENQIKCTADSLLLYTYKFNVHEIL